ncbi:hypothetical protein HOE04_01390 [archaeon]|mgnify:CR=1 FL=1|jgi:hypothetical protein|nr:hypothetical protein [archaeon]
MKFETILGLCVIFLLGFVSSGFVSFYLFYGLENPFSSSGFLKNDSNEAPFDFVKEEQIRVYDDKVVIELNDASISRYAPTGSMRPVLDKDANGIRIEPDSEEDVHIGDIITFRKGAKLIIHRVIEKGVDNDGIYFITKGDNSLVSDGKIRFDDIKYITVGIIW